MRGKLSHWRTIAGLDFHVLVTLLFRGWSIVAGTVTVFLLPLWLSPIEQGYYYTFGSVLALQIFFELGLNQVLMQLVSHEVAHLTLTEDGRLTGAASHLDRLGSLARVMRRWYAAAALLFAVVVGIAGVVFFAREGALPISSWLSVWSALACFTAINLWYSSGLAVMEGCGKVGEVARLRLVQSVIGCFILWIALLCGAGLWVAVVVPIVSSVGTGYWLRSNGNLLRWLAHRPENHAHVLRWRTDVLPLQWRISVSWVSGYFIFNLFTPLVFSHSGAIEAGRFGMALSVFSAATTIGMSWVNAKAPNFTMHISRGEPAELNALFKAVVYRSIAATTFVSLGFVCVAWLLVNLEVPVMSRIASPGVLAVLALVTVANSVVSAAAVYMRAHREEPMLPVSVVTGVLTATAAYFGVRMGVLPMVLLYAAITIGITLPWTLWLFAGYLKKNR